MIIIIIMMSGQASEVGVPIKPASVFIDLSVSINGKPNCDITQVSQMTM